MTLVCWKLLDCIPWDHICHVKNCLDNIDIESAHNLSGLYVESLNQTMWQIGGCFTSVLITHLVNRIHFIKEKNIFIPQSTKVTNFRMLKPYSCAYVYETVDTSLYFVRITTQQLSTTEACRPIHALVRCSCYKSDQELDQSHLDKALIRDVGIIIRGDGKEDIGNELEDKLSHAKARSITT